jgi:hypothetical protein
MKEVLIHTNQVFEHLIALGATPKVSYDLEAENVFISLEFHKGYSNPYYAFHLFFPLNRKALLSAYRTQTEAVQNFDFTTDSTFFDHFLLTHYVEVLGCLKAFNQQQDDYTKIAAMIHIPRMLPVARKFGL